MFITLRLAAGMFKRIAGSLPIKIVGGLAWVM
jgi:hypothetical protein